MLGCTTETHPITELPQFKKKYLNLQCLRTYLLKIYNNNYTFLAFASVVNLTGN